ncbi:MAG: hypothetical protein KDC71_12510 [Acidobacteria bacterium]|nr:hypothetical protein [Acidobacteriota bacterium]
MKAKWQEIQNHLSALFDAGQWQTLSSMLKQVFPLLPQFWSQTEGTEVEPDGYEGISRSGLLEAMLPTDLAMAQLMPLEFLRRYNMAELNYLKRHYTPIHNGGRCLVLLNVGPYYWGSPKLVQLAFLIGMYLRCQQLKVDLTWSTLTFWRPNQGLNLFDLKAFLKDSTFQSPNVGDLSQKLSGFDEVWSVGCLPDHPRVWKVEIEEDEADTQTITLRISRKGQYQRKRILNLPSPELQLGVLRRPQSIVPIKDNLPSGVALPFKPDSVWLSPNGHRFVLHKDQHLAWAPIGSSIRMQIRWRKTSFSGSIVSIGFWKNALRLVSLKNEIISNHHPPLSIRVPHLSETMIEPLPWAWQEESSPPQFFLRIAGNLCVVDSVQSGQVNPITAQPISLGLEKSMHWLGKQGDTIALFRGSNRIREILALEGVDTVFFAMHADQLALAYVKENYWHLGFEHQPKRKVRLPPDVTVLGLSCNKQEIQLVWLEKDHQALSILRGNLIVRCPNLPGPFLSFDINPIKGLLAVLTTNHHLVIYNLHNQKMGHDQVMVQFEGSYR